MSLHQKFISFWRKTSQIQEKTKLNSSITIARKSLAYLDKFIEDFYKYKNKSYKERFFDIPIAHMRTAFPTIIDQIKLVFHQISKEEIRGDTCSMLIIVYWRIAKYTFFPINFHYFNSLSSLILMEYLIQSNSAISLQHDYEFRNQRFNGFSSPIVKIFESKVYVKVKMNEDDFALDNFKCFSKCKGIRGGYVYEIRGFLIYNSLQSNLYGRTNDEEVMSYLDSIRIKQENPVYQDLLSFSNDQYDESLYDRMNYYQIFPPNSKTYTSSINCLNIC